LGGKWPVTSGESGHQGGEKESLKGTFSKKRGKDRLKEKKGGFGKRNDPFQAAIKPIDCAFPLLVEGKGNDQGGALRAISL